MPKAVISQNYYNVITLGDCLLHLPNLKNNSVDLFISDIPYGISLDDWDVLHSNSNSALLGESPAQNGKPAFKRRGKPINGWSNNDKNIGTQYQAWCQSWSTHVYASMKEGSYAFVFGGRRTIHRTINAFENSGFILKDMLAWKKNSAFRRAQRVSHIFTKRGLTEQAQKWQGWRLGNLAPIWEPIALFMKPYKIGSTITDNLIHNQVGALNWEECSELSGSSSNMLAYGFAKGETKIHEAQKPEALIEHLIKLTTRKQQIILDPFIGSGTTAVAAKKLNRQFIGFEANPKYHKLAQKRILNLKQILNNNSTCNQYDSMT